MESELKYEREDNVFLKQRLNNDKKKKEEVEKIIKETITGMLAQRNNDGQGCSEDAAKKKLIEVACFQ
jgi:ribosomal protein L13